MSDDASRAWQFYIDDMIGFADKVIAYTNGLDQDRFIQNDWSGLWDEHKVSAMIPRQIRHLHRPRRAACELRVKSDCVPPAPP